MKFVLSEISEVLDGSLKGDPDKIIAGFAPFDQAQEVHITLADSPKYLKRIGDSRAGAVIVPDSFSKEAPQSLIAVSNPRVAFAKVLELFYPSVEPESGVSPSAVIEKNVKMGEAVWISHNAVIGSGVSMGSRVKIHPGVVLGDGVTIGDDVTIYPNVTIREHCIIGSRVTIHAGTVIGSDGFGFAPDGEGYYKIPHVGIVRIDDDVEIGSLNAIDRGTLGETRIKQGVKTDNLVQIAHNVTVGENTLLVSQVGIAGSTTIGKHAILAGQAGISGHLNIGDNAIIGPQAGLGKSVDAGEILSGSPGIPHKLWLRVQRIIPMLPELKRKISELEKRLKKVEEK